MEVTESINIFVPISGKMNKIHMFYLNWLRNKFVKTEGVVFSLLFNFYDLKF
jgi:hypothetical protein